MTVTKDQTTPCAEADEVLRASIRNDARAARRVRLLELLIPVASVAVFLVIYEYAISGGVASERYVPGLRNITSEGFLLVSDPSFWSAVAGTFQAAFLGFAVGTAIAVPVGLVSGRSRALYRALRLIVDFLRPLPSVALVPLVLLLWGPTTDSKVFLVAFTVIWPMYIQTVYAVQDANPVAIDTARSFGLSRVALIRRVILPSCTAYLATAFRLYMIIAVLVAVSAEVAMGGGRGLGSLLTSYAQVGDFAATYALIFLIGILGVLLTLVLTEVERRALHWHPSHRGK